MKSVQTALENVNIVNDVFYWTDALDCLHWVTNSSTVWQKFVQSRVEKIRNNSQRVKWRHCPGKENPADIPSRGLDISIPETMKKWLFGAAFLSRDETFWPKTPNWEKSTEVLSNATNNNVCLMNSIKEIDLNDVIDSQRHSSIHKLLRVTSYVMRFIKNIKINLNVH